MNYQNKYESLEKLLELKKNGVLTEEEFENEKKKVLNDTSSSKTNEVTQKAKPKMTVGRIITLIILTIVMRFHNICIC